MCNVMLAGSGGGVKQFSQLVLDQTLASFWFNFSLVLVFVVTTCVSFLFRTNSYHVLPFFADL